MGRIPRSPRFIGRSIVQDPSPRYGQQPSDAASPYQTTHTSTSTNSKFGNIHRICHRRRSQSASMGTTASQRQDHESSPHRHSDQEQRYASPRHIKVCPILHSSPALPPERPREQDLGRSPPRHRTDHH